MLWWVPVAAPEKSPDLGNGCSCTESIDVFSGTSFLEIRGMEQQKKSLQIRTGRVIAIRTTIKIARLQESFTDTEYSLFSREKIPHRPNDESAKIAITLRTLTGQEIRQIYNQEEYRDG